MSSGGLIQQYLCECGRVVADFEPGYRPELFLSGDESICRCPSGRLYRARRAREQESADDDEEERAPPFLETDRDVFKAYCDRSKHDHPRKDHIQSKEDNYFRECDYDLTPDWSNSLNERRIMTVVGRGYRKPFGIRPKRKINPEWLGSSECKCYEPNPRFQELNSGSGFRKRY